MNCQGRRDNLLLYAADALDAAELDELRGHLAGGCPSCAGALAEAQAVIALIPQALASTGPSPGAREVLMRRIAATQLSASPIAPAKASRALSNRRIGLGRLVGVAMGSAAVAAAVTVAVMWVPFREGRHVINTKDLQLVSLDGTGEGPGSRGRIFWDRDHNDWRLYVFDLAPPPPGRTYELWFITSAGEKVAAGTFDVGKGGRGFLELPLPPNLGPVAAAAITDEPMSGSKAPTGKIRLLGKIERGG